MVDPSDLQRFDGKVLTQTVYRHQGLKRDVLPPKQPPNTAETGHKSQEEVPECPDLTQDVLGRSMADQDCRYSAAVSYQDSSRITFHTLLLQRSIRLPTTTMK